MSERNTAMIEKYRGNFLREVERHVEQGEWTKHCMQCGVCAGSCPLGDAWEHSPQKLFMMIRAGQRDAVLQSDAMWMCTSCYNCIVRCPRELPITHIMHGLASYAEKLGLAPKQNPTRQFALTFWRNIEKHGRVNEAELGIRLYFMKGFINGIKTTLKMKHIGLGMLKAKRFAPMALGALVGVNIGHKGVKGKADLNKIIAKAKALEAARANR